MASAYPALVAARASDRGTGHQIHSTFYPYKPSSLQARSTSSPTLAMSPILEQLPLRSFLLPKYLPPILEENRHNPLPYAASLYHPSGLISQITPTRPCGLQHYMH